MSDAKAEIITAIRGLSEELAKLSKMVAESFAKLEAEIASLETNEDEDDF